MKRNINPGIYKIRRLLYGYAARVTLRAISYTEQNPDHDEHREATPKQQIFFQALSDHFGDTPLTFKEQIEIFLGYSNET